MHLPCVDLLLINTRGGLRSPLLCVSVGVEGSVTNWSGDVAGEATVEFAAAAVDPKHSSWEPILIREEDAGDDIRPYTLKLQ